MAITGAGHDGRVGKTGVAPESRWRVTGVVPCVNGISSGAGTFPRVPGSRRPIALRWLRSLHLESVDMVLTDPAYESLEKYRAIGSTTRLKHSKSSSNDWFTISPNARFPE